MARDGVAVDPELAALVARRQSGERVNVRAACARLGVSPKTFYKYLARFEAEGVDGFYPRSRRPTTSPTRVSVEVEDLVVRARKQLLEDGWDAGADQIGYWLEEQVAAPGRWPSAHPLPSRATINRILVRRGLVLAVPQRRPKAASRRFEADRPNTRWQMDGFETRLADGARVVVLHLIDDCSRFDLALRVAPSENSHDVWATFLAAADAHGLPAEVLTDNGTAFSGRRRGWTSALETNLHALGIRHLTSSVAHPQTCGKCERGHQTVRRWLARQPPAATTAQLQTQLDRYRSHYNQRRRKRHLGGLTPAQRYALGPRDAPGDPLTPTAVLTTARVSTSGCLGINGHLVSIGRRHAGATVSLIRQGTSITAFTGNRLIAQITLTRRQRYIPQADVVLPKS